MPILKPTFNRSVTIGSILTEEETNNLSVISAAPPSEIASVTFSPMEINTLIRDYNRMFSWYLLQRDLRPLFESALIGTVYTALIVKQQLKGKTFGGLNPAAGGFGFTPIRPESWYANFGPFDSSGSPITTKAGEIHTFDFTTPSSTGWDTTNDLWYINTQYNPLGGSLLDLRDNVAFYVPFLVDTNPSMKISALQIKLNQKPFFPMNFYAQKVGNFNVLRMDSDLFAGINGPLIEVQAEVNTASALDALAPLGVEFQTAEYGILLS